jgi:threonylcarbamoyladenosine tRNA methylthiotransferase MtaB
VLFEAEEKGGKMSGFTDNYVKVTTNYDPLLVNTLVPVTLKMINDEFLVEGIFDYAEIRP